MFGIIVWVILICVIALAVNPWGILMLVIMVPLGFAFCLLDFDDTLIYLKKQLRKNRQNRKNRKL